MEYRLLLRLLRADFVSFLSCCEMTRSFLCELFIGLFSSASPFSGERARDPTVRCTYRSLSTKLEGDGFLLSSGSIPWRVAGCLFRAATPLSFYVLFSFVLFVFMSPFSFLSCFLRVCLFFVPCS